MLEEKRLAAAEERDATRQVRRVREHARRRAEQAAAQDPSCARALDLSAGDLASPSPEKSPLEVPGDAPLKRASSVASSGNSVASSGPSHAESIT